jgi:tetratricopeptide (TPR) repeat protein
MPLKVAVYAICRNEAAFAARFMAACQGADLVCIADTGSSDGAVERLRELGAIVQQISIDPWRFDDARNAALALIPGDVDICVSLDLDEVLATGWRAALDAGWIEGTTRAFYTFVASHNPDGSEGVQFLNSRIHQRRGYRWRHACHEGLYPDRIEERFATIADLRVDHYPDDTKSRSQYLPLLQAAAAEEPHDARMAFYLAREFYFHARHEEAVGEFRRRLAMGDAATTGERSASMRYIGRCLAALEQPDEALAWLRRSAAEAPDLRDPWVDLAEALYFRQDWAGCYAATTAALAIPAGAAHFMNEARSFGALPEDLASVAAWNLGLAEAALAHAQRALALAPDDERVRANVAFMSVKPL